MTAPQPGTKPGTKPTLTVNTMLQLEHILGDDHPQQAGYDTPELIMATYRANYENSLREILQGVHLVFKWTTGQDPGNRNTCTCAAFGHGIPCPHELSIEGNDERAHQRALQLTLPPAGSDQKRQVNPQ